MRANTPVRIYQNFFIFLETLNLTLTVSCFCFTISLYDFYFTIDKKSLNLLFIILI